MDGYSWSIPIFDAVLWRTVFKFNTTFRWDFLPYAMYINRLMMPSYVGNGWGWHGFFAEWCRLTTELLWSAFMVIDSWLFCWMVSRPAIKIDHIVPFPYFHVQKWYYFRVDWWLSAEVVAGSDQCQQDGQNPGIRILFMNTCFLLHKICHEFLFQS
jgi:hypothetical protein